MLYGRLPYGLKIRAMRRSEDIAWMIERDELKRYGLVHEYLMIRFQIFNVFDTMDLI